MYTLYGMTGSLYTAKVRAYLNYHQIDYVEVGASDPRFTEQVVPKVGRWIVPILQTPSGEYLQDGTCILDYLQANEPAKNSIYTDQPVLGAVAHVLEMFGGEGLLRPAMHYRWNFDETNLNFLKATFRDVAGFTLDAAKAESAFLFASGRMRKATISFGVTPRSQALVEQSFMQLLDILERHLACSPYLLGGKPTIADYGFMGPFYAHLARDPYPLHLINTKAPHVIKWVERMNSPVDYYDPIKSLASSELFADDQLPATLIELLSFVSDEFVGEMASHNDFAETWLATHNPVTNTNGLKAEASRVLGQVSSEWRGISITTGVLMYRFYVQQRITDFVDALNEQDKQVVMSSLADTGLAPLLTRKLSRRVKRQGLLEVWN